MGVRHKTNAMPVMGLVSRVTPVQTAKRNCTRDEGGPFEFGNQVLISSHRKLLWSKAMVVSVAEKSGLHGDAKGKGTSGSNREAESTDAPARGALPRSSDEAG